MAIRTVPSPSHQEHAVTGRIFDIQRFSIHDGPGIRTTVFLKGCPLSCCWCHNPESRSPRLQLAFYAHLCIGCGGCAEVCPNDAILPGDQRVDRDVCQVCGRCAEECPAQALRLIGREATVQEVVETALRDVPFYDTSGGGVTLSGGEPLHQPGFALALLQALKAHDLHTAVETCGAVAWERIAAAIEFTDLFLYDLKAIDPRKHQELCGADNRPILANARRLTESGADLLLRAPLAPGLNDSQHDLELLAGFVLSLPGPPPLEVMPYHRTGVGKYEALGMEYALAHLPNLEDASPHRQALREMGVRVIEG